jgi:hypothetical protein
MLADIGHPDELPGQHRHTPKFVPSNSAVPRFHPPSAFVSQLAEEAIAGCGAAADTDDVIQPRIGDALGLSGYWNYAAEKAAPIADQLLGCFHQSLQAPLEIKIIRIF